MREEKDMTRTKEFIIVARGGDQEIHVFRVLSSQKTAQDVVKAVAMASISCLQKISGMMYLQSQGISRGEFNWGDAMIAVPHRILIGFGVFDIELVEGDDIIEILHDTPMVEVEYGST